VPTIQTDDNWKKLCEDLARQPFNCLVNLSMTLDSSCLSPQFEKIQVVGYFSTGFSPSCLLIVLGVPSE
jgi:hypothetical protein